MMHTIAELLTGTIGLQIHDTPEDREQLRDFLAYMNGQGFTWASNLGLDDIDMDKLIGIFAYREQTHLIADVWSKNRLCSNTPRRGEVPNYAIVRIGELKYRDQPLVKEELSISLDEE